MKIKDIAALCKRRKILYIVTEQGEQQYIGDAAAMYKISGLPILSGDEYMTLFDLKPKERDKMTVLHDSVSPLDMSDYAADEQQAEAAYFTFCYGERVLMPLKAGDKLLLIEQKYLKPVADEQEYQTFWVRRDRNGNRYIVIKNGMLATAAVMPFSINDSGFVQRVYDLADGLDRAAINAEKAQRQREAAREAEEECTTK